ncbi:MAG: hypothetical protein HFJ59_03305 [Clostridia bacterium]|nr:hypothetical protein [Clostridia bacterium]
MKNSKDEKGSVTLYVIISMMFFLIVVVGIYVSSNNKVQNQQKEIEKIQESYEIKDINTLYNENYALSDYIEVQTFEDLQNAVNDESIKYIKIIGDIITNKSLIINKTKTIDLNGFTLSSSEPYEINKAIVVEGEYTTLTIEDSSENKKGAIIAKNTGLNTKIISLENKAKLKLENGIITNNNLQHQGMQTISLSEDCKFIMNGGEIRITKGINDIAINLDGKNSEFILNNGEIEVQDGTAIYTSDAIEQKVIIKNGIIKGTQNSIIQGKNSILQIENGNILGNIIQNATTKIVGGNIEGEIFARQPNKLIMEAVKVTGKLKILNSDSIQKLESNVTIQGGVESVNE